MDPQANLLKVTWLGPIFGFCAIIFVAIVLVLITSVFIHFVASLLGIGSYQFDPTGETIRNLGLVLAAIFGAPFLVWRSFVLAKQSDIAAESLFNEKINSAADGLTARKEVTEIVQVNCETVWRNRWEDDVVGRMVAIDKMYGLAVEDPSAAPRIVKLLAAYVRGNFPCSHTQPTPEITTAKQPRMDLQKCVDNISQLLLIARNYDASDWRLDLKNCDFDGVDFRKKFFFAVDMRNCRFEASRFDGSNFEGANLSGSLFDFATFRDTNFTRAKLDHITLQAERSDWAPGIAQARLKGATFAMADLTGVSYLPPKIVRETFGTQDTKLSRAMETKRSHFPHSVSDVHSWWEFQDKMVLLDYQRDAVTRLEESGLHVWSPYLNRDGMTGNLMSEFYSRLQLAKWPYWEH